MDHCRTLGEALQSEPVLWRLSWADLSLQTDIALMYRSASNKLSKQQSASQTRVNCHESCQQHRFT